MTGKPLLGLVAAALLLAGCGEENVIRVGSKDFSESVILAEMIAILAEDQGIPVRRRLEIGDTATNLEALRRGEIDIYPEYNGTGLVMLGQPAIADGEEATRRVRELYQPLGLTWLDGFGFANNYALAMDPRRAEALGVSTMSGLAEIAGDLSIGIEENFEERPVDGFQPMSRRYAMEFGSVETVAAADRPSLYDMLLDGDVDVIEVFTTDGQIADYELTVLVDDLAFFPVYQAAPLVRADALSRYQELGPALSVLAGEIDAAMMADLNLMVEIEGRPADAVARDALARLGLIEGGAVTAEDPLLIAVSPLAGGDGETNAALRAARRAFTGREIRINPQHDPLAAMAGREARLALVSAASFFETDGPVPARDDRFEAVGVVGEAVIHLLAPTEDRSITDVSDARRIVVGPEGSASHRVGQALVSGLGLFAVLVPVEEATTVAELLAATDQQGADLAIIEAPRGHPALVAAMAAGDYRLVPVGDWDSGANLVRYPFLRQARLPAGLYPTQTAAVETLSSQLVLAGPAPRGEDLIGDQGPGSFSDDLLPIQDQAVVALREALGVAVAIDPTLRRAAALTPETPPEPAAVSPAPDVSILSAIVVAMLIWMIWLYVRPERR